MELPTWELQSGAGVKIGAGGGSLFRGQTPGCRVQLKLQIRLLRFGLRIIGLRVMSFGFRVRVYLSGYNCRGIRTNPGKNKRIVSRAFGCPGTNPKGS